MDHRRYIPDGAIGSEYAAKQQSVGMAGSTAPRELSPVEQEMNRLHASLDRCAAMVDELGRRLGAVRDSSPTAAGVSPTPDSATRGALCGTIRQASYKADSASDELRRFLDELTV